MREGWAGGAPALIGVSDSAPSRPQPPPAWLIPELTTTPPSPLTTASPPSPPPAHLQAGKRHCLAPQTTRTTTLPEGWAICRSFLFEFSGDPQGPEQLWVCARVCMWEGGVGRTEDCTLEVESLQVVLFDIEAQVEGQRVLALRQCSSLS